MRISYSVHSGACFWWWPWFCADTESVLYLAPPPLPRPHTHTAQESRIDRKWRCFKVTVAHYLESFATVTMYTSLQLLLCNSEGHSPYLDSEGEFHNWTLKATLPIYVYCILSLFGLGRRLFLFILSLFRLGRRLFLFILSLFGLGRRLFLFTYTLPI